MFGDASEPRVLVISGQKVLDITVPHIPGAAEETGRLRAFLHDHSFLPRTDKASLRLEPLEPCGDVFPFVVTGKTLTGASKLPVSVTLNFPLGLAGYAGLRRTKDILLAVPKTEIHPGGNAQNMILTGLELLHALAGRFPDQVGPKALRVVAATSSDPLGELPDAEVQRLAPHLDYYELSLPDREAVLLPYVQGNAEGTMALTSEGVKTGPAVEALLREKPKFAEAFKRAACVVTTDWIGGVMERHGNPNAAFVVNPSSAFRSTIALKSCESKAIIAMNRGEAGEVILLRRTTAGLSLEDAGKIEYEFPPSPFDTTGTKINDEAFGGIARCLEMFVRRNPLFRGPNGFNVVCPFTFDEFGGMIVGTGKNDFACFTSIPTPEAGEALLREYCDPDYVLRDRIYVTGAGDSNAAVVALFNTIAPLFLFNGHLHGRESSNRELIELASTIFVSVLQRLIGCMVIHTSQTYLNNAKGERLAELIESVAVEALSLARELLHKTAEPVFRKIERWGIDAIVWTPRWEATEAPHKADE